MKTLKKFKEIQKSDLKKIKGGEYNIGNGNDIVQVEKKFPKN